MTTLLTRRSFCGTVRMKPSKASTNITANSRTAVFTCILIGVAILAVYWRTVKYGFVSLDDGIYV
jgi:hypothetical protein